MSRADGQAATVGTSRLIQAADGRRYAFADHNCFACGGTNPIGMHLAIELGEGTASTTWLPGPNFVGWEEKVHGGLLATLLDEVMAWAPSSFDSWAVTAEMSVRYRSPAAPGEALTAGRPRGPSGDGASTRCRARSAATGRVVAEGRGRSWGSPSVKAELKARYGLPADVTTAGARPE